MGINAIVADNRRDLEEELTELRARKARIRAADPDRVLAALAAQAGKRASRNIRARRESASRGEAASWIALTCASTASAGHPAPFEASRGFRIPRSRLASTWSSAGFPAVDNLISDDWPRVGLLHRIASRIFQAVRVALLGEQHSIKALAFLVQPRRRLRLSNTGCGSLNVIRGKGRWVNAIRGSCPI